MSKDWPQWGLYTQPRLRFSHADWLSLACENSHPSLPTEWHFVWRTSAIYCRKFHTDDVNVSPIWPWVLIGSIGNYVQLCGTLKILTKTMPTSWPNIPDICTFVVLCLANRPLCLFTGVSEEHFVFMLSYREEFFKKSWAVRLFYSKFVEVIGLHDFCCHLLACRFVEFDTSVICHLFMHSFGSFLLRDMFFKTSNRIWNLNCEAGPGLIKTVCKCIR